MWFFSIIFHNEPNFQQVQEQFYYKEIKLVSEIAGKAEIPDQPE